MLARAGETRFIIVMTMRLALLVFAIALSQGTGSVALQHVNYPVKVAFKSCKLVPTMASTVAPCPMPILTSTSRLFCRSLAAPTFSGPRSIRVSLTSYGVSR